MERSDFPVRFKSISDAGEFEGLASTYGIEDFGADVIKAGAFTTAIARQPEKGYPLLWSHNASEPLGFAKVSDSRDGLVVRGSIDLDDPAGERAHRRLKKGIVRGLSIGYSVPRDEGSVSYSGDYRVRTLHKVYLHEVSLVVLPMNPEATVTRVKDIAGAVALLSRVRDIDGDVISELRQLQKHLGAILPIEERPPADDGALLATLRQFAKELRI